jgi:hypothetical protein
MRFWRYLKLKPGAFKLQVQGTVGKKVESKMNFNLNNCKLRSEKSFTQKLEGRNPEKTDRLISGN